MLPRLRAAIAQVLRLGVPRMAVDELVAAAAEDSAHIPFIPGPNPWLCTKRECDGHRRCLKEPTAHAPRVLYTVPGTTERGESPIPIKCFCHNCDQHGRRGTRSRWKEDA